MTRTFLQSVKCNPTCFWMISSFLHLETYHVSTALEYDHIVGKDAIHIDMQSLLLLLVVSLHGLGGFVEFLI